MVNMERIRAMSHGLEKKISALQTTLKFCYGVLVILVVLAGSYIVSRSINIALNPQKTEFSFWNVVLELIMLIPAIVCGILGGVWSWLTNPLENEFVIVVVCIGIIILALRYMKSRPKTIIPPRYN